MTERQPLMYAAQSALVWSVTIRNLKLSFSRERWQCRSWRSMCLISQIACGCSHTVRVVLAELTSVFALPPSYPRTNPLGGCSRCCLLPAAYCVAFVSATCVAEAMQVSRVLHLAAGDNALATACVICRRDLWSVDFHRRDFSLLSEERCFSAIIS